MAILLFPVVRRRRNHCF